MPEEEEEEIPKGFTGLPFGRAISTSLWIRDHLMEVEEDYMWRMYKLFSKDMEEFGYRVPRYNTFYKYFYVLKRLGLIRKTREERGLYPKAKKRVYYEIVPGTEAREEWLSPQKYVFPEAAVGGRRYKEDKMWKHKYKGEAGS